ncbi:hypothetical protein A2313_01085 [Candidatus Roizmanbacteria bacterium RIFOXYB2_FULL_41_10]|nr:MAG: hypothetical protein A2262_04460 [Candidatus Roizmanbacteria bacterium RIFOXYA2_FULL_41_8]OGK71173.1 MAG: hypothetical protein A2313_01085 [Candidatus Roizmanbacteria bacterium RIFOXYB2_FULL_41_10]OGK74791.1 MAG: hypothetical protein A2575_00380 [Candidatus Roizmanbacteria bacterium RIFOXYD1_FULL_41_24]
MKTQYYVQGMHCAACELLIERYLKKIDGVISVQASLDRKTVVIKTHKANRSKLLDKYNQILQSQGYRLTVEPGASGYDLQTVLNALIILATLGLLFYFVNSSGLLPSVSLNQNSSLMGFLLFGVVAGFSTCAALVGGFMLSLAKQWQGQYLDQSTASRSVPFTLFNVGRLISFFLLGGLLGLLGSAFQLSISAAAILAIIVSLIIIVLGLQMIGVRAVSRLRIQLPGTLAAKLSAPESFRGKLMPFLAGAVTFFLPCGFTLLAQMLALATGNMIKSALMMFFFALGTLPSLALLSFSSLKFQNHRFLGSTFNLVIGILVVLLGLYNLNSQLLVLGLPNLNTAFRSIGSARAEAQADPQGLGAEIKVVNGQEIQKMTILASGFEYLPKNIKLKAGVPTELTVKAQKVLGCAAAMYLKGLTDEVIYLNQSETVVNFTPQKGTYLISCSMGMVEPIEVVVD